MTPHRFDRLELLWRAGGGLGGIALAHLLTQSIQPSFRIITAVGRELVDAFAGLHSAGLCYRDISFGNLRVDPIACEAAIIDVDNVGIDCGPVQVKGTGPFPRFIKLPAVSTDSLKRPHFQPPLAPM